MSLRDYIYYDYRFLGIKHKKWYWRLYCKIRKFFTFRESPSKVCLWDLENGIGSVRTRNENIK